MVRIGVYNRYWTTLGGGERYAGTVVEALKDRADVSDERLVAEYRQASVFWHAAGWGEDELAHPERFEHFGLRRARP
jgi:hypothetical protein